MVEERCENCIHYEQYMNGQGDFIYGICRRFPPVAQRVPSCLGKDYFSEVYEWVQNWPRPNKDDYCGEFKQNQSTPSVP